MTRSFDHHATSRRRYKVCRVLWIVLVFNLIVALAKLVYGSLTNSLSMYADGVASVFDGISNIVAIAGLTIAARPADTDHPYGHSKFETYTTLVIGCMLLMAAFNVMHGAYKAYTNPVAHAIEVNAGSFITMGATLAINLCVALYERRQAKAFSSEVLAADAVHTMSDVWVTCSVLVGLICVLCGYPLADLLCSVIVALAILRSAWSIFRQVHVTLSDGARVPAERVEHVVKSVDGVRASHKVRTRGTESEVYMDLHVLVDPNMTVFRAHAVGNEVECRIKERFSQVVDVIVHLEPDVAQERKES